MSERVGASPGLGRVKQGGEGYGIRDKSNIFYCDKNGVIDSDRTRFKPSLITCLEKNEDEGTNRVLLSLDITKKQYSDLIIDTGAGDCLVKKNVLRGEVPIDTGVTFALSGIGKGGLPVITLGKVKASIKLNEEVIVEQEFSVVPDDFPVEEGILGRDFLKKFKADISYKDSRIKLYFSGNKFVSLPITQAESVTCIPARTEMLVKVYTPYKEPMVCLNKELQPNVYAGNCVTNPEDNSAYVSVLNANDTQVWLTNFPVLVPLREFNVLYTRGSSGGTEEYRRAKFESLKVLITNNFDKDLNSEEREKLLSIIENNVEVFHGEGEQLTCAKDFKHYISLYTDTQPIFLRPHRIPQSQQKIVSDEIESLLKQGIIRHSVSPYNFPLVLVPKKVGSDGKRKHRLCVDFRKLNDVTISDKHPLGNISDILDSLGHSRYFSTLDLASGYLQIALHEDSMEKTGFSSGFGHYEYTRMPFGLKNSGASLQRYLNHILTGLQGLKCLVYLDDIIIFGKNLTDHNSKLQDVLEVLKKYNLKLQPGKCQFLRKEINYLGHIVGRDGLSPDRTKISAVLQIESPKTPKAVKSFLSVANYYRNFIPGFSAITEPMNKLIRKDVPFVWSAECEESFVLLKDKLTTPPVLAFPDWEKMFYLTVDASLYALGATLSQLHEGKERPICFGSRSLNPAERRYSTIEREYLAIVWAITNYRSYLFGRDFVVYSDHKPLSGQGKHMPARILKWRMKLSEYSFVIKHKPGRNLIVADFLSRVKNPVLLVKTRARAAKERLDAEEEATVSPPTADEPNHRPMTDDEIKEAIAQPGVEPKRSSRYVGDVKIIFDEKEKQEIIKEAHFGLLGGHPGVFRTYEYLKKSVRWKNMFRDIERFIRACKKCQQNKYHQKTNVPMAITSTAKLPFDKCFMDIVGPVVESRSGNKYILTLIDDLSKFALAAPLQNQESSTVAKALLNSFISIIGCPAVIHTDQGSNFMSKVFKDLCKLLKIKKINSAAYHAQSCAVERFHKPLGEYLRNYAGGDPTSWDEYLAPAVFAYNTHTHRTTMKTPFELVFGRVANVPSALRREVTPVYNHDDFIADLKHRLQTMYSEVRGNLVKGKLKSKKYYDKNNTKPFIVAPGEFVWLRNEARENKFSPLRKGPYEVVQVISPENTSIRINNTVKVVHNNRLSHYNDDNDNT